MKKIMGRSKRLDEEGCIVGTTLPERSAILSAAIELAHLEGDGPHAAFLERLDDGRGGVKAFPDEESVRRIIQLEGWIVKLCLERGRLQRCLKPREWTKAMHDAWNQSLPDTTKAFEALEIASREERVG